MRALRGGLAALNLTSASIVLVGGFLPGGWRYGFWAAAFALQIATPYLHPLGGFSVSPAHFVERHGLVVIIALGESIIALGIGVEGLHLGFDMIVVAILALTVAYYMYWIYFGGDDELAEHALERATDPPRRASLALQAFGYAHYPLLLGIIAFAAGVKKIIGHPFDPAKLAYAVALGGGVALFLLAHAWFRRILRHRHHPAISCSASCCRSRPCRSGWWPASSRCSARSSSSPSAYFARGSRPWANRAA